MPCLLHSLILYPTVATHLIQKVFLAISHTLELASVIQIRAPQHARRPVAVHSCDLGITDDRDARNSHFFTPTATYNTFECYSHDLHGT